MKRNLERYNALDKKRRKIEDNIDSLKQSIDCNHAIDATITLIRYHNIGMKYKIKLNTKVAIDVVFQQLHKELDDINAELKKLR